MPIVSGNVSLYNETAGQAIPPTPSVGMVGLLEDVALAVAIGFRAEATIVLLGERRAAAARASTPTTSVSRASISHAEVAWRACCARSIAERLLRSAQDVSDGGLAMALAECALAGDVGATLHLEATAR